MSVSLSQMHLSCDSATNLRLHFFLRMFVDYVYMLSFQYHCSNIVVSMKLPFTHQPFNIDVAVSLLKHREKLHVLPSLMGELHCSIFLKSKVSFSYVSEIFFFYTKYRFVQYREKSDVLQQLRRDLCILG